ncbi:dna ligase iii [Moniliophthora roreri MCA 2997]|uniref:Dna ligase iii n=2 Tax=Moniliophthora roreri TaxID=221103 RepID=V2WR81_MONRO|nr:dna ligase iii [Moniliophthora roreri MCA 2997]KAI3597795.1 dna ligase iii [Moniliophthora roreri]
MAKLLKFRGYIALVGEHVDDLASRITQSSQIDKSILDAPAPYHITVVTKEELRGLSADLVASLYTDVDIGRVFVAGLGGSRARGVYFAVVIWAEGQQLRKRLGLPPKHFHITLTSSDNHEMDKGIHVLLPGQFPENPSPDFLDHLAFTLHLFSHYTRAQLYGTKLALLSPDSHRGYLRLADAAFQSGQHKLAMLSFACAYDRTTDERVRAYCIKRLFSCSEHSVWGTVFQEVELNQLPDEIASHLIAPWSAELCFAISERVVLPTLCLESREALYHSTPGQYTPQFHKLPRFFRWVIPYHLAAMSTPREEHDITLLASLGIKHVLTLTEETPLPEAWFHGKPITNTFLPIPNYHPPSIEQMDIVIRLMEDESKLPTLIHCGGGKGRAGTVIACYIAAYGFSKPRPNQDHPEMSANDAVVTLRNIRPGSIETSQQEAFVSKWCSTIWKRQSIYPELPCEPPPCPLEIEGTPEKLADLFVLVGLPGSGKSWFSRALLARDAKSWTRISQDDSGSRSSCETEIGHPRTRKVLLDRCNTAASDRKQWLDLASSWATQPVCVWFDYDEELCLSRAQMRTSHPTLPPGSRVRNAVSQMQKVFVRPVLKEGFRTIITVRSFAAAMELVTRLSPPVNIYKFPRTPHIINLGAATEDDLVSEPSFMPSNTNDYVVITEKVDGANMGFSLSSNRSQIIVQNRSHYVNSSTHEQFKKLGLWVEKHREELYSILDRDELFAERYVLFGEWLYATHSIPYSQLPDLFMAFDLYDRSTDTFVDRQTLMALLEPTSIFIVPVMYEGVLPSQDELKKMVQCQSKFWDGRVEGVYLKWEGAGKVVQRGKIVRSDFISGNEHWTKGIIHANGLLLSN